MDQEIEIKAIESLPEYQSDSSFLKIGDSKLEEIGKRCADRLQQLKDLRRDSKYDDERQKDFDSYHLQAPRKQLPYVGYPNLCCPLPRIGVDTFHAHLMFTFGGQEGQFKVLPDFLSKSHMDSAKRAADYMTYVLNYEADLYNALDKAAMDCNKYENGFLEARYVTKQVWETRTVTTEEVKPQVDPVTGIVTRTVVKTKKNDRIKKTIFDGVKVERLDPTSVYASPLCEDIEHAIDNDYLFKVGLYNMRFVEEMSLKGDKDRPPFFRTGQVDKIKDAKRVEIVSRLERNKQQYDGIQVDRELSLTPLELAEAHFREDVNGDGLSEKVAIVFETTTGIVLRASYAECRIVKLTPRPVDGRWAGESIRKASQSLIVEWEAIHNQRVAKGQWSNLPFFFYRQGGRFNPQTLTLTPGRGYPLDNPQDVNFPQLAGPDQSYYQEEKMLLDYFDRILGLGDVIQGVTRGSDTTATNTMQSVQRAGIRLATPINRVGMALEKLIGHIWDLNKQCAPELKEFKVVGIGDGGKLFDKISSTDYDTQVSFKLNMATIADIEQLKNSALMNYKIFMGNPMVMNNPATFYQLTQQTMDDLGMRLKLPLPPQAKAKSPFLEHDLMEQGEKVDPIVGEDVDEHMKAHMAQIQSDEFKNWPVEAQKELLMHYDKTQILKHTLESANLNQSGIFEGMNGPGSGAAPAMSKTQNPAQMMNNLRAGESPASAQQNVQNGAMPQ